MEMYNLPLRKIVVIVYQDSIYRRKYYTSTLSIHKDICDRFNYVFDVYFRWGSHMASEFNIMLR
jgi:hypothetical protein